MLIRRKKELVHIGTDMVRYGQKRRKKMQLKGKFIQELQRDPDTGIGYYDFFIRPEKKRVTAVGLFRNPDVRANYLLDGDYAYDGTFRLQSARQWTENEEEAVHVLTNRVSGMRAEWAEKVVQRIGPDIFGYARMNDDLKQTLLGIPGLGEQRADAVAGFLRDGMEDDRLVYFLASMNVPYNGICTYMSHGGSLNTVMENPFILYRYGVSFLVCDRMAARFGQDPWAFERLDALVRHAVSRMKHGGHTRMEYDKMVEWICAYANKYGKSTMDVPKELAEIALCSSSSIRLCQDGETMFVTDRTLFDMEKEIVANFKRLMRSAKPCSTDFGPIIEDVEQFNHICYNEEQKSAFELLSSGGIAVLLGGPGTGKTTTINGLVQAYRNVHPSDRILLCAPTGRAASRMSEVSGFPAMTMHKSMGLKWYNRDIRPEPLPYDLIIADEMSMCDTELLAAFLAAIPSGTTVLLVGDYDQLPSVGPGQVLRDLAESAILPVFHLKETIRQKAGSTIIKNAIAMRRGEQLVQGADFQIHVVRDDDAILNVIRREGVRKDTQYMIPVKPGKAGGNAVNRLLQEMVTGHGPCVRVGNITFYENDRIIMNHNNYPCGYMNGDVGILTAIHDGQLQLEFRDKSLCLPVRDCDGMTLSYALTVHKSQGAECDRVHLLLPEESGVMASRELLYTAITRAKKEVVVTAVPGMVEKFLNATKRGERESNLKTLLCHAKPI